MAGPAVYWKLAGRPCLIRPALVEEAGELLALQRRAYESEAILYGDRTIPPLTQSIEHLSEEIRTLSFWSARVAAVLSDQSVDASDVSAAQVNSLPPSEGLTVLAGSVRARLTEDGVCHIGRLMVDPPWQGLGLGRLLLETAESGFPQARCFELFTGHRSERNLRLYRCAGYRECGRAEAAPGLILVTLRKENRG